MRLLIKYVILTFVALLLQLRLFSQANVNISNDFKKKDIAKELSFIPYSEGVKTIGEFLEYIDKNKPRQNRNSNIHIPLGEIPSWYYINISNNGTEPINLIGEIPNFWILNIKAHMRKISGETSSFEIGTKNGFYKKTIPHKYAIFPISLNPGEGVTCILEVSGKFQNASNPFRLYSESEFQKRNDRNRAYCYAIFGAIILFTLLALALSLITRVSSFVYYFLYVFSGLFLVNGIIKFGFQYIYPDKGVYASQEIMIYMIVSSYFLYLMVYSYFKRNGIPKFLKKLHPFIGMLALFFLVSKIIQPYTYDYLSTFRFIFPASFISFIFLLLSLTFILSAVFKLRSTDAYLFLLMIGFYILASSLAVLINQNIIPSNLDTPTVALTGVFLDILILTVIFSRKLYLQNLERQQLAFKVKSLQFEEEKANKLEELHQIKNKFLANISHEFRTPLTLINGNLDRIDGYPKIKKQIREQGNKILSLINQLLQLSHLQSENVEIKKEQRDIMQLIRYLVHSYESWSESKDVQLVQKCNNPTFYMDLNYDFTERIISNLLSNAIKYTPNGGTVKVSCEASDSEFQLIIEDTGIGIPESEIHKISDRFFRASNAERVEAEGVGIGLAMVKEMIEKLRGKLIIQSDEGKGSTFSVIFPVTNLASVVIQEDGYSSDSETYPRASELNHNTDDNSKSDEIPVLLIIEDNKDISDYIKYVVGSRFNILNAENGEKGVEIAQSEVPDIILTDIMMPILDGYGVLDKIKSDRLTSHIPVVFLTAKVDATDKLKALQGEADAYLTKPFNKEELLLVLENLLKHQERLQLYFSNGAITSKVHTTKLTPEIQFLNSVNEIIENNLENLQFDVEFLAQNLAMSRSQLYRKTKAITNRSIVDYIRFYRLDKARQLMQQIKLNISEVSIATGFNDPAYFSRCFKNEFGTTPQEYKEALRQVKMD